MDSGEVFIEVARGGIAADDLAAILDIEQACFSTPWSAASLARETELAFSLMLLARDASTSAVIGYVCRWRIETEIQLLKVAVDPGYRRSGIARSLVEAVCREAADLDAQVTLEVDSSNAPAVSLYEALGFLRVGERQDYYGRGRHALLMAEREHRT